MEKGRAKALCSGLLDGTERRRQEKCAFGGYGRAHAAKCGITWEVLKP